MEDYICRNCGFRFIPQKWLLLGIGGVSVGDSTAMCIRCLSNATSPVSDTSGVTTWGIEESNSETREDEDVNE